MFNAKPTPREKTLEQLATCFMQGGVTILTGAGLSTASGLPDFRGRDGLWTGETSLGELLTAEGAKAHYQDFTNFCKMALREVKSHRANLGHIILGELQKAGLVDTIITQNVDGYHQEGGATNVIEVHGSLRRIRCTKCRAQSSDNRYLPVNGEVCLCLGERRPDIVLFGEPLSERTLVGAIEAVAATKLLVCIGTTMEVAPISMAASMVVENGGQVAIFNNAPTVHDHKARFLMSGDITADLADLYRWIVKLDRKQHQLPELGLLAA